MTQKCARRFSISLGLRRMRRNHVHPLTSTAAFSFLTAAGSMWKPHG